MSATTEPSKSVTHHRLHLDPPHHHTAYIQIHHTITPHPSRSVAPHHHLHPNRHTTPPPPSRSTTTTATSHHQPTIKALDRSLNKSSKRISFSSIR
ncbi:hypothetical protein HanRHA438_Chr02g0064081 [Helianthus annuus]|nr:hypothetical protein HanRHA438_Chr02g0064081 [Helianthus annuus]